MLHDAQNLNIDNQDIFEIAKKINIPKYRIVFTNSKRKKDFFKNKDFLIHIDNCEHELNLIRAETKTLTINVNTEKFDEKLLKFLEYIETRSKIWMQITKKILL